MKIDQKMASDRVDKPVSMLAIVPKTGAITRIGRQAYTVMLAFATKQSQEQEDVQLFTAPLNSIIRGYKGNTKNTSEVKRHLRSMVSHVVEWQSPSPGETSDWGACALLSEVRLTMKNGENWVSWAYPPSLRDEMLNPGRFAQVSLATTARFRSHAGLALYEICARYRDNPSHLTSQQPWRFWVPVLTGRSVSVDECKSMEFRYFYRDVVKPAVEEVNEVSELIVTSREIKVGRTIEFLQFEVHRRPETKEIPEPVDLSEMVRALELGIDQETAEELYLRYGGVALGAALMRLTARLELPTRIISKVAYLKKILAGKSEGSIERETEEKTRKPDPAAGAMGVLEARQRQQNANDTARTRLVRSELEALDENIRNAILSQLAENLRSRNAPLSLMRRLEEGKWESSLVMGELMRFYWRQTRGVDWSEAVEDLPVVQVVEQTKLF